MNLNFREIRRLNIKSLSNRRCNKRCCTKCLLLLRRRESVCTFDHQSFFSVVVCLGVCLLCIRLSTRFSTVSSVVIAYAVDISLLFKLLLKFRNVSKLSERQAPVLVI